MIYNKPDYSTGVWADEGNIAYPTSEKIEQGHIVEKPFYEIMNYLQNRSDTANAYLLQNGLPDWDRLTTYPIDAYIKHSGVVYKALSQNVDSEPSPTSQIWTQAFADYEKFADAVEDIRKIKEDEGYLGLYVSKAQPVMTGKAQGVAYLANAGLISTGNESVGYSFNQHQRDGIFHDGNSAVAMDDGVITGKFTNSTDSMQYLTRSQVNSLIDQAVANAIRYKVGDLYLTTNTQNPSTILGYGTWQAYAEGRALVGVSRTSTNPEWTKYVGGVAGQYEVTLTTEQIPPHEHQYLQANAGGGISVSGGASNSLGYSSTTSTGGGKPHDNVQPSISVYVWRRTA